MGYGSDSLALGMLDGPGIAVIVSGPASQAFVGDADDPVLCEGDLAAAVNLTTGIGCALAGEFRYVTPPPLCPPRRCDLPAAVISQPT